MQTHADWLRGARDAFAGQFGSATGELIITVRDALGNRLTLRSVGTESNRAASDLKPIEQDILQAIGRDTIPAREVAARAGYKLNAYFRRILSDMRKRGLLTLTLDGYQLPPVDHPKLSHAAEA